MSDDLRRAHLEKLALVAGVFESDPEARGASTAAAFLEHWGPPEQVRAQRDQLDASVEWWEARVPQHLVDGSPQADAYLPTLDALRYARERFQELADLASEAEAMLEAVLFPDRHY